jgi:hypothetical protein
MKRQILLCANTLPRKSRVNHNFGTQASRSFIARDEVERVGFNLGLLYFLSKFPDVAIGNTFANEPNEQFCSSQPSSI